MVSCVITRTQPRPSESKVYHGLNSELVTCAHEHVSYLHDGGIGDSLVLGNEATLLTGFGGIEVGRINADPPGKTITIHKMRDGPFKRVLN